MDLRTSVFTIVLLLWGFSKAVPIMQEGRADNSDTVDITTRIMSSNNASSELLIEGDLVVPRTRNALICWNNNNNCLWKKSSNGIVEVPYTLSSDFSYDDKLIIDNAMATFNKKTCIRFVPHSSQYDYISIENRYGCFSPVGKTGGKQVVSLNRQGCVYHGIVQHELNHALGFYHEQTRRDRDHYVRINWDNISPSMTYNFSKRNTNTLNTPYDYSSIMHYGRTAFAIQYGVETITPIPDASVQIGQGQDLSDIDIQRINLLYGCCE
ncbi:high choriolytic enzyme 1-like isoform X2 [Chanos chanos]|uniref:Metalloendopeptidase n=1 Tax=Chanos chanos TaxID=29144 RepID=A0A6J2UP65_CHACN|nr:high choriolytic enzyme 1-like isoform X2 [Chanos chanos]